jgi:hypothetical protein
VVTPGEQAESAKLFGGEDRGCALPQNNSYYRLYYIVLVIMDGCVYIPMFSYSSNPFSDCPVCRTYHLGSVALIIMRKSWYCLRSTMDNAMLEPDANQLTKELK